MLSPVGITVGVLLMVLLPSGGFAEQGPTPNATPMHTPTPGLSPGIEQCGDVNGDRDVTVTDGVGILRAAAGLPSACDPFRCDTDGNGSFTVTDGVRALRAAAGLDFFGLVCPPLNVRHDLSDFTRFDFAVQAALGFCPPAHLISRATIERDGPERYRATLTMLEEGTSGDPDCVASHDPCFKERTLPERVLSAAEVDTVLTAFAGVVVTLSPQGVCVRGNHFDPCVIHLAAWDDLRLTDFGCDAPRLDHDQVREINELVDSLN